MGMQGNMNDSKSLKLLTFYNQMTHMNLFCLEHGQEGVKPYIIEDKGYPFLPSLMIPHMQTIMRHTILGSLYNK
jgi:hypothetical protein